MKGRIDESLAIVNKRLERTPFILGGRPTIADISLVAYLYYLSKEFDFDLHMGHPAISAWIDRIKALPGWANPYDLMPGHPPRL